MNNDREIRERLKARRKYMGYTYEELAQKTGLSKSTLQRYETGSIKNLALDKAYILAQALNVQVEYFLRKTSSECVGNEALNISPQSINEMSSFMLKCVEHGYSVSRDEGILILGKGGVNWGVDVIDGETRNKSDREQLTGLIAKKIGRLLFISTPLTRYYLIVNDDRMSTMMNEAINEENSCIKIEFLNHFNDLKLD